MTGLVITGAVLVLILAVLLAPVRLILAYDQKIEVTIRVLWLKFGLVSDKPKKAKPKKPKKKESEEKKKKGKNKNPVEELFDKKDFKGLVAMFKDMFESAGGLTRRLFRRMHITVLTLRAKVGGENAAVAAISAGQYNAYAYSGYALLHHRFGKVCAPDFEIQPDYFAQETVVYFKGELRASVGSCLAFVLSFVLGYALKLAAGRLLQNKSETVKNA